VDAVAAGFVVAALGEAVVLHHGTPGLLAFAAAGAPLLAVLALRRSRPALPICVIGAFAVLGTTVQSTLWPDASDTGGVWMFALLFAAYSLGRHALGRAVLLGGAVPLLVALAVDLPSMSGWAVVNGVVFVTAFVGVLPTAVGRVVRIRRDRIAALARQRVDLLRQQRAQCEAAILTERLTTTERLQPALLEGLRRLADEADAGAEPARLEESARTLLRRTREEVVALAAPVDIPDPIAAPSADYLGSLRAVAQPWSVIGGGAIGAGLALESTGTLELASPAWVAVLASAAVGLPLAWVWRRPLLAVGLGWIAATVFSRMVASLDGTLSSTAFTLAAAFAVAALCSRRVAVAGLAVCWCGQLIGVGTDDPFGEAAIILVCWLGGIAVNEVSRLVEQGRENNRRLIGHEAVARQHAIIDERLRLARELHDQIGHSLTVVALQAGAARRLAGTDPARVASVLATIATAAREGLGAIEGDVAGDLHALVRRTRAAGLDLRVDASADEVIARLDAAPRQLVVRIVQEALTNVLRHAAGATASVSMDGDDGGVSVVITNGPPRARTDAVGSRRGLTGLAQQAAIHGGDVRWRSRPDGGFEVRAELPARLLERAGR
jgi:signal transduction histidine kinase